MKSRWWAVLLAALVVLLVHAIAAPLLHDGTGPLGLVVTVAVVVVAIGAGMAAVVLRETHRSAVDRTHRQYYELVGASARLSQAAAELAGRHRALGRRDEQIAVCEGQLQEQQRALGRSSELFNLLISVLRHLAQAQLPAVLAGEPAPATPEHLGQAKTPRLVHDLIGDVLARVEVEGERREAMRLAAVALARKLQAGALRVHREAEQAAQAELGQVHQIRRSSDQISHSAQQLARHCQSVVILAGEWPGQQWQRDEALVDVARAASGRIEPFRRIRVEADDPELGVRAPVVESLIHVLAELMDNAAQSSPPALPVPVRVFGVANGAAVEIVDSGVGLPEHQLGALNEVAAGQRLVGLDEVGTPPKVGLAVVGHHAARHELQVTLEPSPYGGIRAIVLVPKQHLATVPLPRMTPGPAASAPPATSPTSDTGGGEGSGPEPGAVQGATASGLPRRRHSRGLPPQRSRPAAPPAAAEADLSGPERERLMHAFVSTGDALIPGRDGAGQAPRIGHHDEEEEADGR